MLSLTLISLVMPNLVRIFAFKLLLRFLCGGGGIVGKHVWVTVVACACMLSCTPHKVIA